MRNHKYLCTIPALFLLLVSCTSCSVQGGVLNSAVSADTASTIEAPGFDSPEGPVKAYLEALRDNDLKRMISTFAVESYVDHYNLQSVLEATRSYSILTKEIKFPSVNKLSRDINIENRKNSIVTDITIQYAVFCQMNEYLSTPVLLNDDTEQKDLAAKLSQQLNALDLNSLKILGYIPPESLSDVYSSEANMGNMERQAAVCGAESLESQVAVVQLGKYKYIVSFDVIKYNDKWYNKKSGGNISYLMGVPMEFVGTTPLEGEDEQSLDNLMIPIE